MLADSITTYASIYFEQCLQTPYGNKHSRQWQLLWWIIAGSAFIWLMTFMLGLRAGAPPPPPPLLSAPRALFGNVRSVRYAAFFQSQYARQCWQCGRFKPFSAIVLQGGNGCKNVSPGRDASALILVRYRYACLF